jgi:VacB/RNase II family 3'-5' exoribonuclease
MRTKDLIAKRDRRERKQTREKRNMEPTPLPTSESAYVLPSEFPEKAQQEAEQLRYNTISEQEIMRRRDMRSTLTFTIDPDDAKDFDDALSFKILDTGNYQIGIHIADVTHYVSEGTAIDEEAYQRGTSIYLVDRVIPMLPEELCNELCSLREGEDKLCMSVVVEMDQQAKVIRHKICRTVICSNYRLSYQQAQEIIENPQTTGFDAKKKALTEALVVLN